MIFCVDIREIGIDPGGSGSPLFYCVYETEIVGVKVDPWRNSYLLRICSVRDDRLVEHKKSKGKNV